MSISIMSVCQCPLFYSCFSIQIHNLVPIQDTHENYFEVKAKRFRGRSSTLLCYISFSYFHQSYFSQKSVTKIFQSRIYLCLLPWYESLFQTDQSSPSAHISICPAYIQDLRLPWHESLFRGDHWLSCPQAASSITGSVSQPARGPGINR